MRQSSAVAAAIAKLNFEVAPSLRSTLGGGPLGGLLLSMLLWKYLSDVDADRRARYMSQYGENSDVTDKLMRMEPFALPAGAAFDDIYRYREERLSARSLVDVFYDIEKANPLILGDVLLVPAADFLNPALRGATQDSFKKILLTVMDRLAQPDMDFRPSNGVSAEIVGGAYTELVSYFAAQGDPNAAGAIVPLPLCDLVTELVQPREYDSIYDPACGTGGFLLSCARFIRHQFGSTKYTLAGQVESLSSYALAKANLVAYGELDANLVIGDVLGAPGHVDDDVLRRFDLVVGRVPFHLVQWDQQLGIDDKYGRFARGVPVKSKPDFAYISHMIASMKDSGRLAVIAPLGVLFRGYAESDIRRALVIENLLDAIIQLPDRVFYDTAVPTVVLIFKKGRTENDVLIIDASNEFAFGRRHNEMLGEHVGKIVTTYRFRQVIPEFSRRVAIEEIRHNDYNLNISRYIYNKPLAEVRSLADIYEERAQLEEKLSAAQERIAGYLKLIGVQ